MSESTHTDGRSIVAQIDDVLDALNFDMAYWKMIGLFFGLVMWVSLIAIFRDLDGVGGIEAGSGTELAYLLYALSSMWAYMFYRLIDDVLQPAWQEYSVVKYARYLLSFTAAAIIYKDSREPIAYAPADVAGLAPQIGELIAFLCLVTAIGMFVREHQDRIGKAFGAVRGVVD